MHAHIREVFHLFHCDQKKKKKKNVSTLDVPRTRRRVLVFSTNGSYAKITFKISDFKRRANKAVCASVCYGKPHFNNMTLGKRSGVGGIGIVKSRLWTFLSTLLSFSRGAFFHFAPPPTPPSPRSGNTPQLSLRNHICIIIPIALPGTCIRVRVRGTSRCVNDRSNRAEICRVFGQGAGPDKEKYGVQRLKPLFDGAYFAGQEPLRKSKTSQSNGDLRTFRMSRESRVFPNRHGQSTMTFRYSVYEINGINCERDITNGLLAPSC